MNGRGSRSRQERREQTHNGGAAQGTDLAAAGLAQCTDLAVAGTAQGAPAKPTLSRLPAAHLASGPRRLPPDAGRAEVAPESPSRPPLVALLRELLAGIDETAPIADCMGVEDDWLGPRVWPETTAPDRIPCAWPSPARSDQPVATVPICGIRPAPLEGRHIIITGASRGIGAACAIACAGAGAASLCLIARSESRLAKVAEQVRAAGGRAVLQPCDVTDTPALQRAIGSFPAADVLINCAGANQPEPFADVTPGTFERLWRLNVQSVYFASQAVARHLTDTRRSGVIINVSSQMGHVGAARRTVYCATKHAVEGITKALAVELAPHGIRVVSVAPTFVRTEMTAAQLDDPDIGPALLAQIPLGHFATAEQVAATVVYAASDAAGSLTGSSLVIDGGWTAQ